MKRVVVGGALVLGLVAAVLGVGLGGLALTAGDPPQAGRVSALGPPLAAADLSVGGAVVPLTPPPEVPLGGFASRRGRPASGTRDPVAVRALVMEGTGGGLALVAVDVVLVPPELAAAVDARARAAGLAGAVVTATHTHNGPGGFWDNPLAQVAGLGAYDAAWAATLVDQAEAAMLAAREARRPARLVVETADAAGECRARAAGRTPDPRLLQLRFEARDDGDRLGQLVVFGCHPTLLGASDHRLSAGWPGALSARLGEPTLVLQGGLGDVTAVRGEAGLDARVTALGRALAEAPRTPLATVDRPGLAFARAEVVLPGPQPDHLLPPGLRRAGAGLLGRLVPPTARVSLLRVGPVTLALTPTEPVGALTASWEARLAPQAPGPVRVVALADGYLGYLETAEAFAAGAGESQRAFYGPRTADALEAALVEAQQVAGSASGPLSPEAGGRP